jgi:hypothetical protein
MRVPSRRRRRHAAVLVAALTVMGYAALPAGAAGGQTLPTTTTTQPPLNTPPPMNCQPEQYPAAHAPNRPPTVPYEIPVTAKIDGGYFQVNGSNNITLTLGGPNLDDLYGNLCGLLQLPSQSGGFFGNPPGFPIPGGTPQDHNYNNNVYFYGNPSDPSQDGIPVCIGPTGVPPSPASCILTGYAAAEGSITAQIEPTPGPGGGLNVDLYSSSKSTSAFNPNTINSLIPTLGTVPGVTPPSLPTPPPSSDTTCTLPIGNLYQDGLPQGDLSPSDYSTVFPGATPLPPGTNEAQVFTTPVHFTTGKSGSLMGQPVTGPPTDGSSVSVSNDFWAAPISPDMPPAPQVQQPGVSPQQACDPTVAQYLNQLIGLPVPPGRSVFKAPAKFAINVCNEPGLPRCNPHPTTFG